MKKFLATMMVFLSLALAGCGDDHPSAPPQFVADILSDPAVDGDIRLDTSGAFTISSAIATQNVLAGIDPTSLSEFRAFLDFPLTGSNGVPANAIIVSATLDFFVNSITVQSPGDTIPIRIDLISFPPPLIETDFDRTEQPALDSTTFSPPISSADIGQHVTVDVTNLMITAQNLGLANFQVRILEDLGPVIPGLVEINDTTGPNQASLAPLLEVVYR